MYAASGGRFFLDGAKQPLFWLCELENGAAPGAGLVIFFKCVLQENGSIKTPLECLLLVIGWRWCSPGGTSEPSRRKIGPQGTPIASFCRRGPHHAYSAFC